MEISDIYFLLLQCAVCLFVYAVCDSNYYLLCFHHLEIVMEYLWMKW